MESAIINLTKRIFEIEDMSEIFGMSRKQLNHWTRLGYIKPSIITIQKGRVVNKSYDLLDIYSVGLFKHLVENTRIPKEIAAEFVMMWKKFSRKTHKYVIYDNDYLVFSRTRNEVTVVPFCSKPKKPSNERITKTFCFSGVSRQLERIDYEETITINYKKLKEFIESRI